MNIAKKGKARAKRKNADQKGGIPATTNFIITEFVAHAITINMIQAAIVPVIGFCPLLSDIFTLSNKILTQ